MAPSLMSVRGQSETVRVNGMSGRPSPGLSVFGEFLESFSPQEGRLKVRMSRLLCGEEDLSNKIFVGAQSAKNQLKKRKVLLL